jgi:MoaA/NifB/PqqE/SkfB family radical SAM enzyme
MGDSIPRTVSRRGTTPIPVWYSDSATDMERFSVYNNLLGRGRDVANPLSFLLPESDESGWHVSRNLLKPLNHLDFLERKECIAATLNLHSLRTPAPLFDANYGLLERHQLRELSTSTLVSHLATQLQVGDSSLSEQTIRSLLAEYATVRHMEFHPTDICNLSCRGCTYGHDEPETKPPPINFPFNSISKVAALQPKSAVIIGGGEPTLYSCRPHRFQDMVDELRTSNPDISLALTTNGTYKPPGPWPDGFRWIRVSLDAATAETYTAFRGKRQFEKVVQNFLHYLDHDVDYVGVSFLFAQSNVNEYAQVAKFVFDLVEQEKPHALEKVNIQYRPLRRDPYHYDKPFDEAVTGDEIVHAVQDVIALAGTSLKMERFLREQTNITAILGGSTHPPHEFSRCHYSQTFKIVRANGDLRPCFIRVAEPDFILGNILLDSLEAIALNTLYVGARRKPHCDAHGCRQCHVNYTFEKGLSGELKPSTSAAVLADPMY